MSNRSEGRTVSMSKREEGFFVLGLSTGWLTALLVAVLNVIF